jgi:signal transduction histidine kinase
LNTPLATVLMCVEGILRDAREHEREDDWSRIGESAAIAREQILRCKGITQHFLRLSRGQPAAGDIIDLQPVIASVARLIEPTARAHNVTIDTSPTAGPVHVRADESELQHAVINLLLNAVQACGASGHVALSASNGSTVVVRVADNGCGIAPQHQKRIFEPFFSMRNGGTGLGLFLALNFVRRWGGDIVVESSPGHGSVFEVRLPPVTQ